MTTDYIKEYLPMLRDIQAGVSSKELESKYPYFQRDYGLCFMCFDIPTSILQAIFIKWPKYSGNQSYPVPDKNGAQWKYDSIVCHRVPNGDMCSKRTKYGRLRRELAGFLADELEKELNKEEV